MSSKGETTSEGLAMKFVTVAAAAALLVPATAGFAQATPYKALDKTAANPNDPNKLVCEREQDIGSRVGGRKVCLTVQQWRDKHNEQRGFTEDMQAGTRAMDSAVQPPPAMQSQGPQ
jgi:hypothetical protein